MKRAKLGDAYAIKVPNGYKIYQWAYKIPKYGNYIRVFDGLYDTIPNNIEEIVSAQHSYIVEFSTSYAYKIGLSQYLGNYPVPKEYPFPDYKLSFSYNTSSEKLDTIHIMNSNGAFSGSEKVWQLFNVSSINELPEKYRDVTLLNTMFAPSRLLYLFDNGFDLQHPEVLLKSPQTADGLKVYLDMIDAAMEQYKNKTKK